MHPRRLTLTTVAFMAVALVIGQGVASQAAREGPGRNSRLFRVDHQAKRILGPATHVDRYLGLQLISVSMDQPQYWPHEKVRVKVLMPTLPRGQVKVTWNKRDATPRTTGPHTLDANGVAVVEILDGKKQRLQLGEYRVVVKSVAGPGKAHGTATKHGASGKGQRLQGHATFSVVEGTLGALSLAYEFTKCTSIAQLDRAKGGWFLGNPRGAGTRWGNGLSFKNELRVSNLPYNGKVEVKSRCFLPGCNGCSAGPAITVHVKNGRLAGTMKVGGHSGPFQIEIITPKGSLRHLFEGSSHVEREMLTISKGVFWKHRAGLAPYKGTAQVPGRQLFVDRKRDRSDDAFEVPSIIAQDGRIKIKARKSVRGATVHLWSVGAKGEFELRKVPVDRRLRAGQVVTVPISQPYSLVAVGGFAKGKLAEGYAVVFPPTALKVTITAPPAGAPKRTVPVTVSVTDAQSRGVAASGILEAFDNRVASRSPATPLASSIGDSVRNVSRSLTAWVDPIQLKKERERRLREDRRRRQVLRKRNGGRRRYAKPSAVSRSLYGLKGMGRGGGGAGYGKIGLGSMGAIGRGAGGLGRRHASVGRLGKAQDRGAPGEAIRKGQKKVVFCQRVELGADGRATVRVTLPPQIGRVTFRFVAVKGLDHATAESRIDITKRAYAELKLPNAFVPGAKLAATVEVANQGRHPLTLTLSGPGIRSRTAVTIPPGNREVSVPWHARESGTIVATLYDRRKRVIDRRIHKVRDATSQAVTSSRIRFGRGRPVRLSPGETAVVFRSPGELLGGTVMNMVTTMESWFGHAEALSAQVAVRAAVLAAIHRKLIGSEGLEQTLRVDLDKAVRDLHEQFFDRRSGLIRPYPGMPTNPRWSAWVSRNLHSALRHLKESPALGRQLRDAVKLSRTMTRSIDRALHARSRNQAYILGGYDPARDGLATIPVEVNGRVVYRVVTDDAVQRFVVDRLAPLIDPGQKDAELAFGRAYDTFRFLRAFKRTGALQYLTEAAKAAWHAGPRGRRQFYRLFDVVARGMIATQEPGMIQGPAMLGGVYSSPMALVRFLELMLLTSRHQVAPGKVGLVDQQGPRTFAMGQPIRPRGGSALTIPPGAVARIDTPGRISLTEPTGTPFARATVSRQAMRVGQEAVLRIQLDANRDPLEYYALIAVPSTTSVKQTADILSDYKGKLIYGQRARGSATIQYLAVPFRGARNLRLLLEGLYPGTSDGLIAIRHLSNPADACTLRIRNVMVQ